jgi:hypothetical protein
VNDQLKELSVLLSNGVFAPTMKASNKEGILAELSDLLVASGKIKLGIVHGDFGAGAGQ